MLDVLVGDVRLSLAPFDEVQIDGQEIFSAGPWGRTLIGHLEGGIGLRFVLERWLLPHGVEAEQHDLTVRGASLGLYADEERISNFKVGNTWDELRLHCRFGGVEILAERKVIADNLSDDWRSAGGTPMLGLVRLAATAKLSGAWLKPSPLPRGRPSALAERSIGDGRAATVRT